MNTVHRITDRNNLLETFYLDAEGLDQKRSEKNDSIDKLGFNCLHHLKPESSKLMVLNR